MPVVSTQKYIIVRRNQFSIFMGKKQDFGEKIYKTLVLPAGAQLPRAEQEKTMRCARGRNGRGRNASKFQIDENRLDESPYYQVIFSQKTAALFTVKTVQSPSLQEFLLPLN